MSLTSKLAAAFCAVALLLPVPAFAAAKWLRADTHNFVIYSSGGRQELTSFATKIEQFDAMLRLLFKVQPDPQPERLTIFVLRSADNVSDLVGDKGGFTAGFYSPSKYGSFAVANREDGSSRYDLNGDTVLLHEYAHHFMFHQFAFAYPAWYVEGFAEYTATAEFARDGGFALGRAPMFRAYGLIAAAPLPIDTLLFNRGVKMTPIQRETYYGESWLLVHMLGQDPARKGQLDNYLHAIASGTDERAAATATFGDLAALAKDMARYKTKPIVYTNFKGPLRYNPALQIAELEPVASRLVELTVRRRTDNAAEKTRDALKALAGQAPGRAEVWLELGLAEHAVGGTDDAARAASDQRAVIAADHALALDPKLGGAYSLKAELTMDRLNGAKDATPAQWREVRALIGKANAADTEDPTPLFLYHESFLKQGIKPSQVARDGLFKAFLLRPEALDLRASYAFDLARNGNYDEALRVIELVARDPHNPAAGEAIIKQIKNMRDGVKPKSSDAARTVKEG